MHASPWQPEEGCLHENKLLEGVRRMPRHWLAMKGAEGRDRPRGAVFRLRSAGARMGKPGTIFRATERDNTYPAGANPGN